MIFFGPEVRITDEEKHEEAMSRARRTRGEQEDETATLGRMFARNADGANAFSKLSRYETAIERRQTTRQGGAVPEPTSWMSTPRMSQRGIGEFGFVS